ncbi:resuscitation-promoting factor [uncultured Mobiluncus sp.]|uniref:resuscitation-promoting factor n=1 Tax=uncultured Mobiluncus sp. TaxID=293425 RepID=UPI0025F3F498|nr:resuscitation-promoting factor [uncultured Mobiluncus sp.]
MEENTAIMSVSPKRAPRHLQAKPVRGPRKFFAPLVGALVATLVLGTGIGTAFAMAHKTATVVADGKAQELGGWGATVSDLLTENGVNFSAKDSIVPGPTTAVKNGMKITIESSRGLTVMVNDVRKDVDTTEKSASAAIKALWEDQAVQFVGTSGKDLQGMPLALFAPGEVYQLVHDGATAQMKAAKSDITPEDILARNKVKLTGLDQVQVLFNPGAAPIVQVQRITEENVTTSEPIQFETETTNDDSKFTDEKVVTQKGVAGVKEITKKVRSIDGVVSSEETLSEKVVTQPVSEKVTVGTKKRPASQPIAATGDVWSKLAFCEAGGRPDTNTGNGFYGMYQFTLPTWRSVGGSGLPSEASAEEQTHRAQILQARSGWGQWPACSRRLGLR